MTLLDDLMMSVNKLTNQGEDAFPILQNHHAIYCIRTFFNVISDLCIEEGSKKQVTQDDYIPYDIPVLNRQLKFFSVFITQNNPVMNYELDHYAAALQEGIDYLTYRSIMDEHFGQKRSFLLGRLKNLHDQQIKMIRKINEQFKFPASSLEKIVWVMTFPREKVLTPNPSSNEEIFRIQTNDELRNFLTFKTFSRILIPADIPADKRDKTIIQLSEKIHDLLVESFLIIMVSGMRDFELFLQLRNNGADMTSLKNFLDETTCFLEREKAVELIDDEEDLNQYISDELEVFGSLSLTYQGLIKDIINKKADNFYPLYEGVESANQSRNKSEYKEFAYQIEKALEPIFVDNPLETYVLHGSPRTFVKYISTIIRNKTISLINVARRGDTMVNSRRLRRWKAASKSGIIDPSLIEQLNRYAKFVDYDDNRYSPNDQDDYHKLDDMIINSKDEDDNHEPLMSDPGDPIVMEIQTLMLERQKHEKRGYLTQNKLIEILCNKKGIEILNKKGIPFKLLSRSTLRTRLKLLINSGEIEVLKEGSSNYFKNDRENILKIASLITTPPKA